MLWLARLVCLIPDEPDRDRNEAGKEHEVSPCIYRDLDVVPETAYLHISTQDSRVLFCRSRWAFCGASPQYRLYSATTVVSKKK